MRAEVGSDVASGDRTGTRGAMLLAIANAIVRVHKKYFGKGPTKARAYYDGDVVTCVLRDVYTRAERTLLDSGRSESVLSQRHELQLAVRDEFIGDVERITGRKVIAFFSGNHADPDIGVEVFVLEPQEGSAD
jgi:uncharacterized protein YbcI